MAKEVKGSSAPVESSAPAVKGHSYRIAGADAVSVDGKQINAKDGLFILTDEQVAALVEAGHKPVVS